MEFITIVFSGLMALLSPVGWVSESVAENALRDQLQEAEAIAVRMDTTPSYQVLAGQLDRVQIAGRGLYPLDSVRIDTLDIETDPIDVDFAEVRQGTFSLDQPLQAMVHLVLTVEDINRAFQSPTVTENLRDLSLNVLGENTIGGLSRSDFVNASLTIRDENRLRFQTLIREQNTEEELEIELEFGLNLMNGHQINIQEPRLIANGEEFPPDLLVPFTEAISREFTLRNLEQQGITIRLLQLEIEEQHIGVVAFARLEPSSPLVANAVTHPKH